MFCPKCGAQNEDGAQFCSKCGNGLTAQAASTPTPPAGPAGIHNIPNYLVWAILTTLFCCLPFGIVSIVKAAHVGKMQAIGDYDGAMKASKEARNWAIASALTGVGVMFLYIIFMMIVGVASSMS